MLDWKKCSVSPDTPIRDVLQAIERGTVQIALVIGDGDKLLGTVTDGDVRRGILAGADLGDSIEGYYNRNPVIMRQGEDEASVYERMKRRFVNQVPVINDCGQVVDFIVNPDLLPVQTSGVSVVLMAGGLGSRLRPLTEHCPKPLLKVGGKPILEIILGKFSDYGFRDFYLSVNYKADMIRDYFGDGSKFGVNITYVTEDEPMGTAGALGLLPECPNSPLIVMNGDLLTEVNYKQLLDFHYEQKATATMCVREYDLQVPYGVVKTNKHRLLKIEEKPNHSFFVNAGIYVLSPEVLDMIPAGKPLDMPVLFDRIVATGGEVVVFPIREYWLDIGRMDDFKRAQFEFGTCFNNDSV